MCSAQSAPEKIHVDVSSVPQTMLGTLYGRAMDADADKPILGDIFAKEVVSRLDYDWSKTGLSAKQAPLLALRPAHFDDWARQFLAVNDRAVVLHLGCGLDGRVFRLNPGPEVEWYDVDYPNVIALFEQIYPHRKHHHLVPASVTDPAWLQAIPPDRPVLMIAEGLVMYLTEHDGVALLRRIVDRFPQASCISTCSIGLVSKARRPIRSSDARARHCTGRSTGPTTSCVRCPAWGYSQRCRPASRTPTVRRSGRNRP
jgi:O-methyltransferase involved in polyketide biosynthesis